MTRQKGVWSSCGNLLRAGVLFLALGAGPVEANDPATQKPFAWPGGAKAAVSLTYDDAVPVHYQKVGPLLSKHGLGATFYLTVQYLESPREWRKLSKRGHELGNHTLFHACRQDPEQRYTWLDDHYDLQDYSEGRLRDELAVTNKVIDLIDGGEPRTYGNTCNHVTIGKGDEERSMEPVLRELFVASRGEIASRVITPGNLDFHQLGHFKADGKSFEELKPHIDSAIEKGGWVIFMVHGVGEGNHPFYMEDAEHAKLVEWLGKNKESVWTAPVVDVATHLKRR